jgi:hypothetical protein
MMPEVWHQTIFQTTDRGRWRRETTGGRSRHYVYVGPFRIRVPWLAWALFS